MSRVVEQYQQARRYLAGGVNASTRLNRAVGHPMLFERGAGCRIWDLDGKEYFDLCCSHGATMLGHGDLRRGHRERGRVRLGRRPRGRHFSQPGQPIFRQTGLVREFRRGQAGRGRAPIHRFESAGLKALGLRDGDAD